jgi:hypothetical protein
VFRFGMRLVLALLVLASQTAGGAAFSACCDVAAAVTPAAPVNAEAPHHSGHHPPAAADAAIQPVADPGGDMPPCSSTCPPDGCPAGGCVGFLANLWPLTTYADSTRDSEPHWISRLLPPESLSPLFRPPISA